MLTPDFLEYVADDIIRLYAELEAVIIKDISRRIVNAGTMTETARHQIRIMQESGMLHNEIIQEIANITNQSENTIRSIFEDSIIEALSFDNSVYRLAGLNPLPIDQSPRLLQALTTGLQKTNRAVDNFVMTTAIAAENNFKTAINQAYLQVTTGAFDYNTAIFNAVEELSKNGVSITYPSGRTEKLDVAVRRAVLTGVNQTAGEIQDLRAEELGCDLVEVTAHEGARVTDGNDWTNHAWWQGKVYSRSGTHTRYRNFIETTGKGKIDGLLGVNCRHNFHPFFEGISTRSYTDEELEEINNRTVTFRGKEIGKYEATQMQRAKEREIRALKRELAGYEGVMLGTNDNSLLEEAKLRHDYTAVRLKNAEREIDNFTSETGLGRDMARERVVGFDRATSMGVVSRAKEIRTGFDGLIGINVNRTQITGISNHIIERALERKVSVANIQSTLTNPLNIGKIKTDRRGRQSFEVIGENATVCINPNTGAITTAWRTGTRKKEQLMEGKENEN